jgi:predicted alpha-1,2-mannosidase
MEEEAAEYAERAQAYRLVFDESTGFHRGKLSNGAWAELQEFGWGDHYTEGNAWQYAWLVPHDAPGLAEAFGGADALLDKLDVFMDLGTDRVPDYVPPEYYWHGNEPDLHAPFLYAQLGRPESTDQWVRWIQDNKYSLEPAGYPGNDDGGTLASWYAFSAMGLYPINGTDRYVLFPPLFDAIRIQNGEGWLEILREGEGEHLVAIELGGQDLDGRILSHEDLLNAGQLHFVMGGGD